MRLKSLELYGFKSFAARTLIVFDKGITAVVGPNGSGKSNLADALRWVLGEQSFRSLRARSTEDMIFAGSPRRPQMSVAQVSLTLDNTDGSFPLDFSEITITRRAYRSGENEYFLNGQKVRLRDVEELLAGAGFHHLPHTFISQGLVDATLSLKPQERRELLEEVSGIAIFREKREEAIRKLEEAEANLARLKDILAEISPSLEKLREQSQKAAEYLALSRELSHHLKIWYGYRIHLQAEALKEASREEQRILKLLEEARLGLEKHQRELEEIRAKRRRLQEELSALRRTVLEEERAFQEAQRARAVLEERIKHLTRQKEELEGEIERWEKRYRELLEDRKKLQEARARWEKSPQRRIAELSRKEGGIQEKLDKIRGRLSELEGESARARGERERLLEAIASVERELASLSREREAKLGEIRQRERELSAAVGSIEGELSDLRAELSRLQGKEEPLLARLKTLENSLKATPPGNFPGPLMDMLRIPQGLEKAIEAALSPFQEGWIAGSLTEALGASASAEGRSLAVLLLRPMRDIPPLRPPEGDGIMGLASELVKAPEELMPLLRALLGRTLVVRDAEAALQAVEKLSHEELPYQVVTLKGEKVHSFGAVEKVRGGRSILLAEKESLEAELRSLGGRKESLRAKAEKLEAALREAKEKLREISRERSRLEASWSERVRELELQKHKLQGEFQWYERQLGRIEREKASLVQEERKALSELEVIRRSLEELRAELEPAGLLVPTESPQVWEEREASLERELRRIESELQLMRRKAQSVGRELEESVRALQDSARAIEEKSPVLEELARRIEFLEKEVEELGGKEQEALRKREEAQKSVHQCEILLQQARIALEKARDELASLRHRLQEDLGLVEAEDPQRPLGDLIQTLPRVAFVPPGLEEEIRRLRGRIKRLGPVNLEAPEEFRALEERHRFLSSQIADLEDTASRLRNMIKELDREMGRRFMEVFHAVNEAFGSYFQELFSGGKARLILTDSGNWEEAGIEIEAAPPGKKLKELAMLSGGERSLTAVAFLFAILKVKPVPFCVLDEVDAMLDEANIGRFCSALKDLSRRMQFIVITHNRATIEVSDIIWGVTMNDDGISQVFSVKLDEAWSV